ncbi:hypothetical protein thsrh120_63940 [Rhizobium sp. No.120]
MAWSQPNSNTVRDNFNLIDCKARWCEARDRKPLLHELILR